tara:strand:+ start:378 stop:1673 length:1296 start_codon:yes stop_codon:yes gene_type:complete
MFINFISDKKKEIFFLILLTIFFYRSPFIFLNGRFMAEEGSVYFANAYQFSFLYSFLFVDLTSGYINLWANISGILANLFSLKFAPLVSNYLALIPKIFIIILVLYNKSILLVKFEYKVLVCFLIFLSPTNVPEIWLNSINSQIFFCIISFILVFSHYEGNRINYFHLILIFIAGLTGVYSCILFPVFFLKYIIFKNKQNLFNFLSIFVCSIIQLSLILYAKLSNILYEGKIHSINFDIFINYTYNVFVKAFLGTSFTKYLYYNYLASELNLYLISIIIIFIFIVTNFFLYNFLAKSIFLNVKNKFIFLSLFYSLISTSFVVMTGAVGDYVGGRYAVLPSFYLLMIVLTFYILLNRFKFRYFFLLILITSISIGAYEFRPPTKNVKHQYIKYLDCVNCPNWENEINNFQLDKSYQLKIWPYPRKTMSLISY